MAQIVEQKAKEEVFVPFVRDWCSILLMRANLLAAHRGIAFVQRKFRLQGLKREARLELLMRYW